jgi:hypothetical protein
MPPMGWTMLYLFVFLKLPIVAACAIVWWAVHQDGEPETDQADDGGSRPTFRHGRRWPRWPRPPRRGPHGDREPPSPPRVRSVTARGRERELER